MKRMVKTGWFLAALLCAWALLAGSPARVLAQEDDIEARLVLVEQVVREAAAELGCPGGSLYKNAGNRYLTYDMPSLGLSILVRLGVTEERTQEWWQSIRTPTYRSDGSRYYSNSDGDLDDTALGGCSAGWTDERFGWVQGAYIFSMRCFPAPGKGEMKSRAEVLQKAAARLGLFGAAGSGIVITTDPAYEQGEAVVIKGSVLLNGEPAKPDDARVMFTVAVPGLGATASTFGVVTDGSGSFTAVPFAGWNTGAYTLTAKGKVWDGEKGEFVIVEGSAAFTVTAAATVTDMGPQLAKIRELYKEKVPEGPIRTSWSAWFHDKLPFWVSESRYGQYHNLSVRGTRFDPQSNFVCGGYQSQVLQFLDSLRFHRSPEVRALLKGLDYGPVARGLSILGGHHAVVLYPIGTDWKGAPQYAGQFAKVLDPWPKQKPEMCSVSDFMGMWGNARADGYFRFDPANLWNGYPLTGGAVYVNYEYEGATWKRKKPSEPATDVAVNCPVDVLVENAEGQRVGALPGGELVMEFPALAERQMDGDRVAGWYFGLPEGSYRASITGREAGTFQVSVGDVRAPGEVRGYGEQQIDAGATAVLSLGTQAEAEALTLADGRTVMPGGGSVQPPVRPDTGGSGAFTGREPVDALRSFNDGQWNDLSGVFTAGDTIYLFTDNKFSGEAQLDLWLGFESAQSFSLRHFPNPANPKDADENCGADARLTVTEIPLTGSGIVMLQEEIPDNLQVEFMVKYPEKMYRLRIVAPDSGYHASYALVMSTPAKCALGKATVDVVGGDAWRAKAGIIRR